MKLGSIYNNLEYKEEGPAVKLLLETSFTKEIRITLKKEQMMKEHQAPFPIVVQVVEGKIDFGVGQDTFILIKGDMITLEGKVPHNLKAHEDSIIRLTLSKSDRIERVQNV